MHVVWVFCPPKQKYACYLFDFSLFCYYDWKIYENTRGMQDKESLTGFNCYVSLHESNIIMVQCKLKHDKIKSKRSLVKLSIMSSDCICINSRLTTIRGYKVKIIHYGMISTKVWTSLSKSWLARLISSRSSATRPKSATLKPKFICIAILIA